MTAYFLTPHYNGFHMLGGNPHLMRCATCNSPTNLQDTPLLLDRKPSGSPQISTTIDEYYIASPAFIRRYEEEGFYGLEFEPLPNGYYHVTPKKMDRNL